MSIILPIQAPVEISTGTPGWVEATFDLIFYETDVILDGWLIRAHSFNPKTRLWPQLRRRLREAGLRVPQELPK